ncbi:hypothetical protein [Mucilaginibacter celer]|uniref:Uncharacterized protein n=1 Tax=Mucilaginibacter celer TaxID=2305508 RepID=A0A494VQU0_9SPHI|nr:hypothetical protein [Mucilaginibacter celer]AYL95660.1 hypothetical protein HYN43_010325 [Mucilaginibacter celer]
MDVNTYNKNIPFEIHITVDTFALQQQQFFINLCLANNSKPLFIQLSKGDHVYQPMLGTVIMTNDITAALWLANMLSDKLAANNFMAKRLKIEIPAEYAGTLLLESDFRKYFEWHAKVNYVNVDRLMQICAVHRAHLSSNSLKNEDDLRFITLREFGTRQQFENRVQDIINTLLHEGWNIIKQESEYCIYDNNVFLDNGWLPQ